MSSGRFNQYSCQLNVYYKTKQTKTRPSSAKNFKQKTIRQIATQPSSQTVDKVFDAMKCLFAKECCYNLDDIEREFNRVNYIFNDAKWKNLLMQKASKLCNEFIRKSHDFALRQVKSFKEVVEHIIQRNDQCIVKFSYEVPSDLQSRQMGRRESASTYQRAKTLQNYQYQCNNGKDSYKKPAEIGKIYQLNYKSRMQQNYNRNRAQALNNNLYLSTDGQDLSNSQIRSNQVYKCEQACHQEIQQLKSLRIKQEQRNQKNIGHFNSLQMRKVWLKQQFR